MGRSIFTTTGTGRASKMIVEDDSSFAFIDFKTFREDEVFGTGDVRTALIQGVSLDQRTNHQINLSLRQTIYLYVFGDQMGEAVVTGFLFSGICGDDSKNGFSDLAEFYSKNRVSSANDQVEIIVGGSTLTGFLTGLHIMATDIRTLLTPFNMTIKLLPLAETKSPKGVLDSANRTSSGPSDKFDNQPVSGSTGVT